MHPNIVADVFALPGRPSRAIVDLDAIAGNIRVARDLVGPAVAILAVVKANAYGHGSILVSQAAIEAGADQLGVATVDEAIQLRMAGIQAPILVLGPVDSSEIEVAIGQSIELAVADLEMSRAIASIAERTSASSPVAVHLKVDTGMHRFGCDPAAALGIARFVDAHPRLKLRGVFTHFACADEADPSPTEEQSRSFQNVLDRLSVHGIEPEIVHEANSAGTIRDGRFRASMIRLGIAMYGLNPSADVPVASGMRPAMTLVSRIARVFDLHPGDRVSYGGTYRAQVKERAALVPIGYADGYRRALSSRAAMYVQNVRCPVLGRVCMDQTVIGLPDGLTVAAGDAAIVAGAWQNPAVASFDELASLTGTINYEIATGISARVPRFYVRHGRVVAVADLNGVRSISN